MALFVKYAASTLLLLLLIRSVIVPIKLRASGSEPLQLQDFLIYYNASVRMTSGEPVYSLHPVNWYVYSPFVAACFIPLTKLSVPAAWQCFFLLNNSLMLATVAILVLIRRPKRTDLLQLVFAILLLYNLTAIYMELMGGMMDVILMFLIAFMSLAVERRWLTMFILLLVLGALTKTWFSVFGIYLLLEREWRAALIAGTLYALALLLLFIPLGRAEFIEFVAVTRAFSSQPGLVMYSIPSMADLYFKSNPIIEPVIDNSLLLIALKFLGCATILGSLVFHWRKAGASSFPSAASVKFGLVISSSLLVLPMCQAEYFLLLFPALALIVLEVLQVDFVTFSSERAALAAFAIGAFIINIRVWPRFVPIPNSFSKFPGSLILALPFLAVLTSWFVTLFYMQMAEAKNAD
jgi:hypothetical protein